MKRELHFSGDDKINFLLFMRYLLMSGVDFDAHFEPNGDSVITFECADRFYEMMMEDVPEIYSNEVIIY